MNKARVYIRYKDKGYEMTDIELADGASFSEEEAEDWIREDRESKGREIKHIIVEEL